MDSDGDLPALGARLREARTRAGVPLTDLAQRSGLTKGFVSQVERDKVSPSIGSLLRMCDALGLSVGQLFAASAEPLVRAAERPRISYGGEGLEEHLLTPADEGRVMVIHSHVAPRGGSGNDPYGVGERTAFVFVLAGRLHIEVAAESYTLAAGDALTYSGAKPHRWSNPSDIVPAEVLWAVTPPLE